MGLVAKAFQDIITFSRATQTGTYVNSSGYITNSSVLNYLTYSNQPENAAWTKSNSFVQQNIQTYSQDFDNAAWTKISGGTGSVPVVTANQTIAPDGTLTADLITLNLGGGTTLTDQSNLTGATGTTTTGAPYNGSIYIIAATSADVGKILAFRHAGGSGYSLITLTAAWQRFSVNENAASTTGSITFGLRGTTGASTGSVSFYAWGAQLVQGSVPGDYRATTSAALPCLYADYNGALRARKFCENAANAQHYMSETTDVVAGTVYTFSFRVKAGEKTQATYTWSTASSAFASGTAAFNLATGVVTPSGAATGTMTLLGNGWYLCTSTNTCTATVASSANYVSFTGLTAYTGDGSSGIYIADAQLNDGSSALAYYDTTASAYNAPRFDYDPVTLAAKGLLVEEQRANLLLQSNDFQTSWLPTNITRTLNSILSPSGNVDGVKIAATAAAGTALYQQVNVAATSATFSVYVKQGTGATTANSFLIRNITTVTNLITGTLNYSTGVYTYTLGSSGVVVTNAGNGWWRVQISATTGITSGDLIAGYVGFSGAVPAAGDFLYAYGSQLEAGAFATSYIPTVASQVTRAADVASVNTLSPWYNSVAGTMFGAGTRMSVLAATGSIFEIGDGTNNNRFLMYADSPVPNGAYLAANGGITQAAISVSNVFPANTAGKIASAYAVNDFQQASNGTLGTADTSGALPTVTTAYIGKVGSGTAGQWNGWIQRITYYPRRLTNAELQTLTTL